MVVDEYLNAELADVPAMQLLTEMYDFMSLNANEEATDELIVELMEGLRNDYGKSTLTLDLAPFDTYYRIATYRLDNESTDNLLAAIDCIESPESTSKRILICGAGFRATVNQAYFTIKLRQLFDTMFTSPDSYDIVEHQATFIRSLALCAKSPQAFQLFYTRTQHLMTAHRYPADMQTYLDRFLFDLRLGMESVDDFSQMYEPSLCVPVQMLTDFQYGRSNASNDAAGEIVRSVLINLRRKDRRRFVILVTHFEAFRHLLDEFVGGGEN